MDLTFPKRQILDTSKLKEFAFDISKFDENCRDFTKRVGNSVGQREIARYEHSVDKKPVLQTRKNKELFGKELKNSNNEN